MKWIEFNPIKNELPIVMFDRYLLQIRGYASTSPGMSIDVSFIREITDTNHVDTLPVFIIDSVCFFGICLDSSFCGEPLDWREFNEYLSQLRPGFEGYYRGIPHSYRDLWYKDGKLFPSGYRLNKSATIPFPSTCSDSIVSVEIQARLLDRATGQELGKETKTVRFLIKPIKKRIILSQSSTPKQGIQEQPLINAIARPGRTLLPDPY